VAQADHNASPPAAAWRAPAADAVIVRASTPAAATWDFPQTPRVRDDSAVHRKVVTVLFCDVVGSTSLGESVDPEALQGLLARYFERMKAIVERYGGSVEKFIGDAVMVVFGVPVVHEDDALRACRAAVAMREAFPALEMQGRIGVNTGEVVVGTSERLATGDAVNVAARLQQAAEPDEVLLGEPTLELVRGAVEVEAVDPLELKGKAERVLAFRLVSVSESPERSHDSRFVGREREVVVLREAWERAVSDQHCALVTVVAEAGVGKSRLVAEALASLSGHARVVRGRCLPYGEGITYWPVTEVLRQLEDVEVDQRVQEPLTAVLGEEVQTTPQEIAWAFRKLIEAAAPIIVVFDDVQWGEEAFLDLIEHVALLASSGPILLACTARPELLDRRPSWPVALRLEPLAEIDVGRLIEGRVSDEVEARIVRAAGGNPLFVQELLEMIAVDDGEIAVPPTLRALLAARLDQLDPAERRVLECAAVEGEIFHLGAVTTLVRDEPNITARLASLVRRALVLPDRAQVSGDDAFRFRHLLIRDAAYDSLAKATRADAHERFAQWLEQHGVGLVELDELLGYHLEQAHRYRAELGQPDPQLARRAHEHLAAAGLRADAREDLRATANLLGRALALLPADEPAVPLRLRLGSALRTTEGTSASSACLLEAAELAAAAGDRTGELQLRVVEQGVQAAGSSVDLVATRRLAEEALAVFETEGNDVGQALAWELLAYLEHGPVHSGAKLFAAERMLEHARAAGAKWLEDSATRLILQAHLWGPTPFPEVERIFEQHPSIERRYPTLMARRAGVIGRMGRISEARKLLEAARARSRELGGWNQAWGQQAWEVERYGGDVEAAEAALRGEIDAGERAGMVGVISSSMAYLAEALVDQAKLDEAEEWAARGRAITDKWDAESGSSWRRARARVLARRGSHAEAEALADEALSLADDGDDPVLKAEARTTLGEVLELAGRRTEAEQALELALALFEAKGHVTGAAEVRRRLEALRHAAPA
jgi:class 3 adenylate cyclase/tetratricopeptide (TPR) repeat protein